MISTIDGAGRVVVPKRYRDELGLRGGERVEITLRDGRIEISPVPAAVRLEEVDGVLVARSADDLPPLSADQVRDVLERVRR